MKSEFNLDGTSNQLRNEICKLQTNIGEIRKCNTELQIINSDDSMSGFMVAVLLLAVWLFGYFAGKMT